MLKIYGAVRVSTKRQNLERQIRNILDKYPNAYIVKETYTGTTLKGNKELDKLVNIIKKDISNNDEVLLVFDEVSRMSRNADEGYALYEELFNLGVNIEFLKDKHINTDVYKKAMSVDIQMTGTNVDYILKGVNEYLMSLAKEQIKLAFEQAEKEVKDLHQRTKEGIETARRNGKQIGQKKGSKLITKKSTIAKGQIITYSKDFDGTLKDKDVIKIIGISRNTYYKYKKELLQQK